jgi:hypothetical protein
METTNINNNVKNNNNIAMKSVNFLRRSLMIQDTDNDTGIEPNTSAIVEDSPGIWVKHIHSLSIEYQYPIANKSNRIYVRIKNTGCVTSQGNEVLNLYWAKTGTSLAWDSCWNGNLFPQNSQPMGNFIGQKTIPSIPPNKDTTVQIDWIAPDPANYQFINNPSQFSLLAKIEEYGYPMTMLETEDLESNVRNNRNIAWKNVTVVNTIDLMIQDNIDDTGAEPNPYNGSWWNSPDIWARRPTSNDDAIHQHLIYGDPYSRVYVRVKNRGNCPYYPGDSAEIFLYWTRHMSYKWYNWEKGYLFIESRPIYCRLDPGEECYVDFTWNQIPKPDDYLLFPEPWHFHLLAVIKSKDDNFNHKDSVENDIKYNNNIAGKSVYIGNNNKGVDLMIKDKAEDYGNIGDYPWGNWDYDKSPDIWVRNSNDGYKNFTSVEPEYTPNKPVYVYVRVRNRLPYPFFGEEGNLALYWTKSSTMESWPGNWDGSDPSNGNVIDKIPLSEFFILPNGEKVFEFKWIPPSPYIIKGWAVCLLARIEDIAADPIKIYNHLGHDIYYNNNIAERNVTIVDIDKRPYFPDEGYPYGRSMYIGNASKEAASFDVHFGTPEGNSVPVITDKAKIYIKTDDVGWEILLPYLEGHPDIHITEDKVFVITKNNVTLKDIHFKPETRIAILVEFHFPPEDVSTSGTFHYRIAQRYSSSEIPTGAEHFVINKYINDERFFANAGEDIYADRGETVVLIAEQVREEAIYEWYDQNGILVFRGMEFKTDVTEEKKYLLKVTAVSDGLTAWDEVEIKLKPGRIETIFPNPTDGRLTVIYKINKAENAYIQVTNSYFFSFTNHYKLDVKNNSITIDMPEYPSGIYILTLVCDERAVESITFMKK